MNANMTAPIYTALLLGLGLANSVNATESGGRIIGVSITNAQIRLLVDTAVGRSYQVQSNTTAGGRFWSDALPLSAATESVMSVSAPAAGALGLFRVLEFTNRSFWYDWKYYYEAPSLSAWGLGTTQNTYVHTDRAYEWYIDQAHTGTYSGDNCGPSSVTMALKWRDPSFSKTAEDARNTYRSTGGWWNTGDIINYLNLNSVSNTTSAFTGTDQIKGVLNESNLVILCLNTAYLTRNKVNQERTGRFYNYADGHFLVVKGYRVVVNHLSFEVYDPNNWDAFYEDTTPKGRNRHLAAADLETAVTEWWNYIIVVPPPGGGSASAKSSAWLKPVDPARIEHQWGR
jgi:hypothetical protein